MILKIQTQPQYFLIYQITFWPKEKSHLNVLKETAVKFIFNKLNFTIFMQPVKYNSKFAKYFW